ncbi:MAG: FtsX-like permease family protein, partial [Acidobacteria bacterium]
RLLDWLRWERGGAADLDDEIRAHLEIETDRLVREERLAPADAQAAARRRFGNPLRAREDSRAVWTAGPLDSWIQDARFGLRLRLAMGASPGRLVQEVLRETAVVIALGLGVGIPCGLFATRLVQAELFGIEPTDPFTLGAAAVLVTLVGLAAGCAPARRASRVDPLTALRAE